MLVKELIVSLQKMNPDSVVTLDTFEGISLLDIDDVYKDESGVVLYGSIMNLTQSRGASKIPPQCMTFMKDTFYSNTDRSNDSEEDIDEEEYFKETNGYLNSHSSLPKLNSRDIYLHKTIRAITVKLSEFDVYGIITKTIEGPTVDTFELELNPGVRFSKVSSLEDDLSLALDGKHIRIFQNNSGKSTIDIEVPRPKSERKQVHLNEIMNTTNFSQNLVLLPLVLGKDMHGTNFIRDLTTLPHLLIGGTTGSGKSIFLNSILTALLLKKSPSDLKLILIDPKRVELAMFSKLPHLLIPTVTDHEKAKVALAWAIQEMERRYQILLESNVKDIATFNKKLEERKSDYAFLNSLKKYYPEDKKKLHLSYIVIVIDELANLMGSDSGKEIEQSISTLAAKASTSGIHLIMATHQPSVDVLSGIIKTNCPTRIAFRVANSLDSRTILNLSGAEKLLGGGDMFFLRGGDLTRLQGAYVDCLDIENLTKKISKFESTYDLNLLKMLKSSEDKFKSPSTQDISDTSSDDEYYEKALKPIVETESASATFLQRRLGIGYKRAQSLIDLLEANGVIGPADGANPRTVFLKK